MASDLPSNSSVISIFIRPKFHALTIGIDKYECSAIPPLSGAVKDAVAVKDHFGELTVTAPICLTNESATYHRIISEFKKLATNDQIHRDDPIIIYFAGHGSTMPASARSEGAPSKNIQLILAHDSNKNQQNEYVNVIKDTDLGDLLTELASAKGNNITVILDCCHSASGTRLGDGMIRGFLFDSGDGCLAPGSPMDRSTRAPMVPMDWTHKGLSSHVLLAACAPEEFAREKNERGVFTVALLKAFRADSNITYSQLIATGVEEIDGQTPHCEGLYMHRLLFKPASAKDGRHGPLSNINQRLPTSGRLEDNESNNFVPPKPFGVFVLSDAELKCDLQKHLHEEQRIGSLGLEILEDQDQNQAQMTVVRKGNDIVLVHKEHRLTSLGLGRLPNVIAANSTQDVINALRKAAHFYTYLFRSPDEGSRAITGTGGICARMVKLSQTNRLGPNFTRVLEPATGEDGYVGGEDVLDIPADDKTLYGLSIKNGTENPIYVWAFIFNASDLGIDLWYHPSMSRFDPKTQNASVLPNGELTIGYGDGGARPYKWCLPKGQDRDASFVKLFFSNQYIELHGIEQQSPFHGGDRLGIQVPNPVVQVWDSITITVKNHHPYPLASSCK
ncbi:hypothetical protein OF83DRAFT_464470 [Amylostereum chailletii]|nr:hypothetical protein OF83DRAFT_464470 [Amylostereum chailletii]